MRIHIAIDGNEANVSHRVGSNVYAFEIIQELEKITRTQPDLTITVLLSAPAVGDLPKMRHGWSYRVVTPRKLWTQIALPLHLFWHQHEYDVLFTPGHYAPRISAIPYVSSAMDLAFLHFPDQFKPNDLMQLKNWTAYSVKNARKVIAISEFTKQDVVTRYHKNPQDVVVAYPAVTEPRSFILPTRSKARLKKLHIRAPYILYVGTLQPRKNLLRLIDAFEMVTRQLTTEPYPTPASRRTKKNPALPQLVIAGKVGWLADDILDRVKNSPLADHIILTGYVTEETKRILYEQASCSVQIGLFEGFGIPPLESLMYKTIPVVSNTTSLPEVVGSAGILVDPSQPADISRGLYQALTLSAKERAQYAKAGRTQLKKFSWSQSARTILDTLLSVVSEPSNPGL